MYENVAWIACDATMVVHNSKDTKTFGTPVATFGSIWKFPCGGMDGEIMKSMEPHLLRCWQLVGGGFDPSTSGLLDRH